MEEFFYNDLFATKGFEYLLVIGALLLAVPFWKMLGGTARPLPAAAVAATRRIAEWFSLPEKFFHHQGHTWALPDEGDVVKVGVNDFAQKLLGRIAGLRMPSPGTVLRQGEKALALEAGSHSFDMVSPVDGEVVEVNPALEDSPGKLNEDPYGSAWLFKVKVPGLKANLKNLLSGDLARRWMEQVKENLMAVSAKPELGMLMQDGGMPVEGMARAVDPENWPRVVENFFKAS